MRKRENELTEQTSFRTNRETKEKADAEAEKYGMSRHELARQVFNDWLDDTERDEIREALDHLTQAVRKLEEELSQQRADLKQALIALLCDAGKLEEDDARRWVEPRLFRTTLFPD